MSTTLAFLISLNQWDILKLNYFNLKIYFKAPFTTKIPNVLHKALLIYWYLCQTSKATFWNTIFLHKLNSNTGHNIMSKPEKKMMKCILLLIDDNIFCGCQIASLLKPYLGLTIKLEVTQVYCSQLSDLKTFTTYY